MRQSLLSLYSEFSDILKQLGITHVSHKSCDYHMTVV